MSQKTITRNHTPPHAANAPLFGSFCLALGLESEALCAPLALHSESSDFEVPPMPNLVNP
eukprot:272830-Amphidinium_carterae.1